jgi:hypothetical protein
VRSRALSRFVDGTVFLDPLKVGQVPPLFLARLTRESHHVIASEAKQSMLQLAAQWIASSLRSSQ